ncbi:hypothetical protein ACIBG8_54415 [Nonomuraea sp. NPDC050556]|uniref:hypothetical protein n=1 Tax=Nonomuraea sp. NPDC050556 TaxID=3364369 RepID=UPI00378B5E2B
MTVFRHACPGPHFCGQEYCFRSCGSFQCRICHPPSPAAAEGRRRTELAETIVRQLGEAAEKIIPEPVGKAPDPPVIPSQPSETDGRLHRALRGLLP